MSSAQISYMLAGQHMEIYIWLVLSVLTIGNKQHLKEICSLTMYMLISLYLEFNIYSEFRGRVDFLLLCSSAQIGFIFRLSAFARLYSVGHHIEHHRLVCTNHQKQYLEYEV